MLFSETEYHGSIPIQSYGKNFFRIDKKKISGGVFVFYNILISWQGFKDLSFLKEDVSSMEILFIGTGKYCEPVDSDVETMVKSRGIVTEILPTPVACRAYNISISAYRKAGALLAPIL